MHLQIAVAGSWTNAAVLFSKAGDEVAFLCIRKDDKFYLEVCLILLFNFIIFIAFYYI